MTWLKVHMHPCSVVSYRRLDRGVQNGPGRCNAWPHPVLHPLCGLQGSYNNGHVPQHGAQRDYSQDDWRVWRGASSVQNPQTLTSLAPLPHFLLLFQDSGDYPLIMPGPQWKKFKNNFCEFIQVFSTRLVVSFPGFVQAWLFVVLVNRFSCDNVSTASSTTSAWWRTLFPFSPVSPTHKFAHSGTLRHWQVWTLTHCYYYVIAKSCILSSM